MKDDSEQYILPALYVTQPLKTLHEMSTHGRIECVSDENLEEQVKLFYNTLQNEILCKPLNEDFKEKCIVLPIKADQKRNLAKGGLVKLIIKRLKDDEDSGGSKHNQSFASPPSRSKTFSSRTKSFSLEKAIRRLPKEQSDDKNGRIENAKSISSIGKTSAQVHCPKQPTSHHTKYATKKVPKEDAMYAMPEETENYDPYKKDEKQALIKDQHKYNREEYKNVDTKQQKAIIQTCESSKNYNNHPFVSNLTEVEKGTLIEGEVQESQYEDGKAKYQYPRPSVIMSTKQHRQQNANELDEEGFDEEGFHEGAYHL
ncbi:uncharacterized protein LOC124453263 [Xenia sp. Carnegie-2017]|uniref:uncharacterized protein LOC124453263 n=1 Tax=Xenia sp. Carnegie-2017 TaxID=2897299 RepID=UPI001F0504C8|nr:uncharacterized protein LOC124453263 [Xenia sp. Carnegie-2017]